MKACRLVALALLVLATQVVGCGSSDSGSPEIEGSRLSRAARKAGCRTICPSCPPETMCLRHCRIECPADTTPCGPSACSNGEVCCNESCGICTPPDGVCTQQLCEPTRPCLQSALCIRGFHWSPRKCMCIPDAPPPPCLDNAFCIRGFHWSPLQCRCVPDVPGQCNTDADCRLFSDYCTGCDCRALSMSDADPTCAGPGVRCFADPCLEKAARCVSGLCTQTSSQVPTPRRPRGPHAPHAPHAPRGPHQPGSMR